jgi:hypothetical protein
VTTSSRLTREQILALPPTITLAELARVLDVSEPTVRKARRCGELAAMGIKAVRLGQQYRVVTASVWSFLGLEPGASTAPAPAEDTGQHDPAAPRVRFLAPVRAAD